MSTGGYSDIFFRLEQCATDDLIRHYTMRDAAHSIKCLSEQVERMTQMYYRSDDKSARLRAALDEIRQCKSLEAAVTIACAALEGYIKDRS